MRTPNIQTTHAALPQIYAYTTPEVARHNGWLKIGYTEQDDVRDRIKQQCHTAGVRWELQWDAEWSGAQNVYGTVDFDPSDASFIVSRNGHRASTWDTVVMVRVWPTGGGADANDTLTAIAYSGATEVARLKFTAYQQAY